MSPPQEVQSPSTNLAIDLIHFTQGSTTSFLTATTLIYAIGAGITAAAGTRLALQLFLVNGFKLYSFQL